MSQSLVLQVAGLYTSINDMQGLPPGALDQAVNVCSRYKNVVEPRRGFQEITATEIGAGAYMQRQTNFPVLGIDSLVGLTNGGALQYYTAPTLVIQDLTYVSAQAGVSGNNVNVTYLSGGTAGSEMVQVLGNAITIQIDSGVSTADQVLAALNGSATALALVSVSVSGTGSNAQVAASIAFLAGAWAQIPGNYSVNLNAPEPVFARPRFIKAGQDLFLTTADGMRSLSSGASAQTLRAGVPKALNIEAATNGDSSGFFSNNTFLVTTGSMTSGSPTLFSLGTMANVAVGNYVTGNAALAVLVVQDLTYQAVTSGTGGNAITIAYTTGGTAGSEAVTVTGNAISVKIQSGVSTALQIKTAINASAAAQALVNVFITGGGATAQTAPVSATHLSGGSVTGTIPAGTTITAIVPSATLLVQTGSTTAGTATISSLGTTTGLSIGTLVTGAGLFPGTQIASITNSTSIVVTPAPYQTQTSAVLTFSSQVQMTMSANATATQFNASLSFYLGSQVAYRILYGRIETDVNGNQTPYLGSPSPSVIVTNTGGESTDVTVTATLPKNSANEISFAQLYRSVQTPAASISPPDQYALVNEYTLTGTDFTNRVITITDILSDSLKGAALYTGSDQQGAFQQNDPPPMAWDACFFRDFMLYGNATLPSTLDVTLTAVGPSLGVQVGDTLTISGTFQGVSFSEAYTGAVTEDQAARKFLIDTSGTPTQNITSTVNSLIRVVNYDQAVPIHLILVSTSSSLQGQILFEADNPSIDTFLVTTSAHASAWSPSLTNVSSQINTVNNGIYVSKDGLLQAVPPTNLILAGDSSASVLRLIPLRDYVIVIKSDGIYKILGLSSSTLSINPFDLTTKIIGSDTAVSLNSAVWMLSNQGVVSISDGGVDVKSIPIDDQINELVGSILSTVSQNAFGIGYESDRHYILSMPESGQGVPSLQYVYNYVTNCWTNYRRNIYTGFIHSNDGKWYISRADSTNKSSSIERKTYTYTDFADEGTDNTITNVNGTLITLSSTLALSVGDILWQSPSVFSPIIAFDSVTKIVTVLNAVNFTTGFCQTLASYLCRLQWKQIFGDNPAYARQFSEGLLFFKSQGFNSASLQFVTDYAPAPETVSLSGIGNSLWGLFPWGVNPWGGTVYPSTLRFEVPQNSQQGSYLIPSLLIQQAYANFKIQGISVSYKDISQEVGL